MKGKDVTEVGPGAELPDGAGSGRVVVVAGAVGVTSIRGATTSWLGPEVGVGRSRT